MMRYNKSIQELTFIDVNASSFIPLFEAMAANENLPLTSLNVSRCPIDEKAMQSLTMFVRKSKQPFVKVNVAESTGDKIGKAGGLQVRHPRYCNRQVTNVVIKALARSTRDKEDKSTGAQCLGQQVDRFRVLCC